MSAIPDQIARRWLASKLAHASIATAGNTGSFKHPAPDSAVEPFTSVEALTERFVGPNGKQVIELYRLEMLIRVWDTGSSSARADAIAGAIHDQINKFGPESVTGGAVISCRRISNVPFTSILEAGVLYQISGGIYELLVSIG